MTTADKSAGSDEQASDRKDGRPGASHAGGAQPAAKVILDRDTAMAWLTRDRRPRVIVDRAMALLWANDAALRDLRGDSPVAIEHGRLRFVDQHWSEVLAAVGKGGARLAITAPDGHRFVVISALGHEIGGVRAILMQVTLGRPKLDFVDSGFAAQFALTAAERQVGELLAEPTPPAKIARELGVSIHTVRTHIRRIYAKLSVRTQAQFLRLAHTYCST